MLLLSRVSSICFLSTVGDGSMSNDHRPDNSGKHILNWPKHQSNVDPNIYFTLEFVSIGTSGL